MLPSNVLLRAWEHDTQAKIGGYLEMAGIDPTECFNVKRVTGHEWIGLTIDFPFPQIPSGQIVRCLTHPLGQLMFDVVFPHPVPPIHSNGDCTKFEVVLENSPNYHQLEHRFFAKELLALSQLAEKDHAIR